MAWIIFFLPSSCKMTLKEWGSIINNLESFETVTEVGSFIWYSYTSPDETSNFLTLAALTLLNN